MCRLQYARLLVGLILMGAVTAFGQTIPITYTNQPGQGVQIISATGDCSPTRIANLQVQLKNTTNTPVVAYVVLWQLADTNGTRAMTKIWNSTPTRSAQLLGPGNVTSNTVPSVLTAPVNNPFIRVTVSVDYVLYNDNSQWGPDTKKESQRIKYIRGGAEGMRRVLLNIYQQRGTAALIQELNWP